MSITRIAPPEAAERLENGSVYLDVRSVREFEAGHAPGAINIPLADHGPSGRMEPNPRFLDVVVGALGRDASIITACAMGGRSLRAATMLTQAGFGNVVDMAGGMNGQRNPLGQVVQAGWMQSELPVTTESGEGQTYASILAKLSA